MTQLFDLAEGLPPPKRLKTHYTPDYDAFQPGSIIRCKLTNFMSYTLTEFHFGPKMNLLIGPNGSGKSTFVCAVCIGLGGKLANLGKESMTTDGFIKDNQNESIIELELKTFKDSPNQSVIITTKLFRNGKTQWEIDHVNKSETEIKKLLKSYNIQLDNLCQFLPQDRVSKFADLKGEELLREIERSYKNGELLIEHNELIKLQNTILQEEKNLNESRELLLDLKTKNEALRDKVDKHRQFLKLKKDMEKTEMIRPYVILQDKKAEMINLKEKFEIEKQEFTKFQEKVQPIEDSLKNTDEDLNKTKEVLEDSKSSVFKIEKELKMIDSKIEKLDNKTKQYLSNMKDYDNKLANARGEYFKLKKDYDRITEDLNQLDVADDEEISNWKNERSKLKEELYAFEDIKSDFKSKITAGKRKLDSIKSEILGQQQRLNSKDRLNTLDRKKFAVCIQAVQTLRNLKEKQPEKVNYKYCEPAIVTLNVSNKEIAPAVETLIPYTHLTSVVVDSKEDYKGLSKILYDERKLMVSLRTLGSGNFRIEKDQKISREKLKELGFDGYISDFLRGPNEIIQMLCENVYLNRIPISIKGLSNESKEQISKEIERGELELVKYVSKDEIYTMNRSSYGRRQVSTNIKSFKNRSSIFQDGLSVQQKEDIGKVIEELNDKGKVIRMNIEEINEELREKEEGVSEKRVEFEKYEELIIRAGKVKKEANKLKKRLDMTYERMVVKKKEVKALKHGNNESSKGKIYDKIERNLEEKMVLIRDDKRELLLKKMKLDQEIIRLNIQMIEEGNKFESIKVLNESIQVEKEEKTKELTYLKNEYKKAKNSYQKKLEDYKGKVSEYSAEDKEDMKDIIEEMASKELLNEEGLNVRLEKLKSEMVLNSRSGGEDSLRQLEENRLRMAELEGGVIPALGASVAEHGAEFTRRVAVWGAELERVAGVISADFGANMAVVASAGSVSLDRSDGDGDVSKWRLVIRVSFRDTEELSVFNGAQHSGGEKSATTAVFLNSLQGLTRTPFRVVDEINQGMDAKNERRAHELIVRRASGESGESAESGGAAASQYFLITPKLLGGLHYGAATSVHCILAGRWAPRCEEGLPYLEMGVAERYL